MPTDRPSFRLTPRLVIGAGIVLIGLLLTADNLGVEQADDLIDYWPVVLIAVGATAIGGRRLTDLVFAFFWIGIGLWLLAWNLGYLDVNPFAAFWPTVLILLGISLILGALRRSRPSPASDSRVNIVAVMGGVERSSSSSDFLGGDVTVFMGGGHLDLRQATITAEEAVIQVFTLWGGYEFRVPPSWDVSLEVLPLLGGVEDKRTQRTTGEIGSGERLVRLGEDDEPTVTPPRLVIKGFVIMGGIDVSD